MSVYVLSTQDGPATSRMAGGAVPSPRAVLAGMRRGRLGADLLAGGTGVHLQRHPTVVQPTRVVDDDGSGAHGGGHLRGLLGRDVDERAHRLGIDDERHADVGAEDSAEVVVLNVDAVTSGVAAGCTLLRGG